MADSTAPRGSQASPVPGSKRRATSLLPAFEPFSSSPALPRPLKRTCDALEENITYPTPVPTSSTAILSSSPPRQIIGQSAVQRAPSTLSERAPLCAVPTTQLDITGKPITMGRSSASCNYRLSANRLISRIHVECCYKPALSRMERDRVEIKCTGWNGVKVHCQGKVYPLQKGETFSSDIRNAQLMIDVHDARLMIQWPDKVRLGPISSDEEEEEEEASPTKKQRSMRRHSTPPSPSPLQTRRRPVSPVSPSPAVQALLPSSPPLLQSQLAHGQVDIYEDPVQAQQDDGDVTGVTQSTQILSQMEPPQLAASHDSYENATQDFSDNDEENDPIIHSFGPFGANLLPRMASFTAGGSPRPASSLKTSRSSHTEPLHPNDSPSQPSHMSDDLDVKSHVINQLAFSRLSSTPLSSIMSHLPQEAGTITLSELRAIMREATCIGEVMREGKDAAGKTLESEYYYIPDEDEDKKRKEAVVNDLMKPGLRACRKQHKQYFWRKPK